MTFKHGHNLGINDPLPMNQNKKLTLFDQTQTRIKKKNTGLFIDKIEGILKDSQTKTFEHVNMRGINGQGYLTTKYGKDGFFVGIHNEGAFKS